MQVFVRQAEHRRGFRGEDVIALPHGLGQEGDIVLGDLSRLIQRAAGDRSHARTPLVRRNVNADAVVFQHAHERLAQLGVVEVGKGVDEIEHAVRGRVRRFCRVSRRRAARRRKGRAATRGSLRPWAIPRAFDEPALSRLPSAQFVSGATRRPIAARQVQTRHHPVGEAHAVRAQVGGLGFHHQFGDIDPGGAFQAATVAVHAQVGHVLERIRRQPAQIDAAIEDAADQVRLGPRRTFFGGQETEDGAPRPCGDCQRHSPQRLQGAVASATRCGFQLTCSSTRSRQRAALSSGQLRAGKSPSSCGGRKGWTQVAHHQVRIVADDLSRG